MRVVVLTRQRLWLLRLVAVVAFLALLCLLWPAIQRSFEDRAVLARSLQGLVVVIDPGHGGRDPGAIGPRDVFEKNIVLPVGMKLGEFFRQAGATVILTRTADVELYDPADGPAPRGERKRTDIEQRLRIVSQSKAELLLSIHANAISSSRWYGAQTFFYPEGELTCAQLAGDIQTSLRRRLGSSRSTEPITHQYLLKNVSVPAATVEIGFMSNPEELAKLQTDEYQRKVAWAIFTGVVRYCMQMPVLAEGQ
jgi:N-acetylmuramoyl-L-alanine amidase